MMGIMLEWYHLLIGMQTTVLLTMVFLGIAVLLIDDLIRSKENVRTVD
jgi:multidrug/hemolysin transport system permease protein